MPAPFAHPFGAYVPRRIDNDTPGPDSMPSDRLDALGATISRPNAYILDQNANKVKGEVLYCQTHGKTVVPVVRASRDNTTGISAPVSDFAAFNANLATWWATSGPFDLSVYGNEYSGFFYSGSAAQYLAELAAFAAFVHGQGKQVCDSGIQCSHVILLTARWLIAGGNPTLALGVAKDGLNLLAGWYVQTSKELNDYLTTNQAALDKAEAMLAGAKAAGADLVNFHWYGPSTLALSQAVLYLKAISGQSLVMTNECGQRTYNPQDTGTLMVSMKNAGVNPVIWFGIDGQGGLKAKGLFWLNGDGSLRPSGRMFAAVVSAIG